MWPSVILVAVIICAASASACDFKKFNNQQVCGQMSIPSTLDPHSAKVHCSAVCCGLPTCTGYTLERGRTKNCVYFNHCQPGESPRRYSGQIQVKTSINDPFCNLDFSSGSSKKPKKPKKSKKSKKSKKNRSNWNTGGQCTLNRDSTKDCQDGFRVYCDMMGTGGNNDPSGIYDAVTCMQACKEDPNCIAVTWRPGLACRLHTNLPSICDSNAAYFEKCDDTTTVSSGGSTAPDETTVQDVTTAASNDVTTAASDDVTTAASNDVTTTAADANTAATDSETTAADTTAIPAASSTELPA